MYVALLNFSTRWYLYFDHSNPMSKQRCYAKVFTPMINETICRMILMNKKEKERNKKKRNKTLRNHESIWKYQTNTWCYKDLLAYFQIVVAFLTSFIQQTKMKMTLIACYLIFVLQANKQTNKQTNNALRKFWRQRVLAIFAKNR